MVDINLEHISVEHKKGALATYCHKRPYCTDEATGDVCPLLTVSKYCGSMITSYSDCTPEEINHYYELVFGDKKVKEPIKHDGCYDCKYLYGEEEEYPCSVCKGTALPLSEEYEVKPDMYEPLESTEPVATHTKPSGIYDNVNHPLHYTNGGIECIDEMELVFGRAAVKAFCLCNVWKYRKRALHKNGQEDLDKADWYMAKYKELEEKDNGNYNKLP